MSNIHITVALAYIGAYGVIAALMALTAAAA